MTPSTRAGWLTALVMVTGWAVFMVAGHGVISYLWDALDARETGLRIAAQFTALVLTTAAFGVAFLVFVDVCVEWVHPRALARFTAVRDAQR